MTARPMNVKEQAEHDRRVQEIERAVLAVRSAGTERDEDLQVAAARLEEWLGQNEGRWTT